MKIKNIKILFVSILFVNFSFFVIFQKLQKKQELYEDKFKKIEAQVIELDNKANELLLENK